MKLRSHVYIWCFSPFCTQEHWLHISQHGNHFPFTVAWHNAHGILRKGSKINASSFSFLIISPGGRIQVLEHILLSSACYFVSLVLLNFLYRMDNFNFLTCSVTSWIIYVTFKFPESPASPLSDNTQHESYPTIVRHSEKVDLVTELSIDWLMGGYQVWT